MSGWNMMMHDWYPTAHTFDPTIGNISRLTLCHPGMFVNPYPRGEAGEASILIVALDDTPGCVVHESDRGHHLAASGALFSLDKNDSICIALLGLLANWVSICLIILFASCCWRLAIWQQTCR
jgi:hypothetical protein